MKKIFVALSLMAALTLAGQAKAADVPGYGVTIGGQIQADMGWQFLGKNQEGNNTDSNIANFFATLNSESYLRAMFTSADKTTGAHIELGVQDGTNYDNSGSGNENVVYLRYAYGWWKVGSCTLLVGQMDGRLGDGGALQALGVDKSGKSGLAGFGFIGATRNPKLALQMEVNDNVSFEIALGQAGAETNYGGIGENFTPITDSYSTDSYLPRLEAVVDFTFDNFTFGLGGGISYQKLKFADAAAFDGDDNVLSYLLWIPVEYSNGPFSVVLNGHFGQNVDTDWTGENTSEFDDAFGANGVYGGQPGSLPMYGIDNNLEDTIQWGAGIDFNFAVSEELTLAVGGGLTYLKNDAWGADDGKDNYTRWAVYVAAPYAITDNFTIQPEVGYYNYGDKVGVVDDDDKDAGDEWIAGVTFNFSF